MRTFLRALGFLTVIPWPSPSAGTADERELGASSALFPLVGLAQGLAAALAYFLLAKVFSPGVTACLIVAGIAASSGAMHLDGLSDTLDALASRRSRAGMLEIMKDGSAGPVGTAGTMLVLLLKIFLLMNLFEQAVGEYFCLVLMPVFGKWSMVAALYHGSSAREDGLGRIFIENTGARQLAAATAAAAATPLLIGPWERVTAAGLLGIAAVGLVAVYLAVRCWVRLFQRRFHGLTGDNIGAINETSEVLFLLTATPFLAG